MADVIPFEERLRKQKEGALSKEKQERLDSFRMVMQCTACPHKCAKCGSQLETPEQQIISEILPLKLCRGCGEEYRLYQRLITGQSQAEGREYYHNQDWVGVWKSWLEYQRCLQQYRSSEEFLKLVEELSQK
ncbi:MAG: hypothetical protein A2Y79_11990 [Deltaproteobacteria bacterium RBG_13_43_22]|nr:MAG: hypothetical protein A2Y79_11990 [Deltaproteobacteria bacterium RBG_13_43_22]